MKNSVDKFNALNGTTISKEDLLKISTQAFDEQQFEVFDRLGKLFNKYPDSKSFELTMDRPVKFDETAHGGMAAPRHKGAKKQALNNCGRLKKGFKFENGKVVKVVIKQTAKQKANLKKKILALKTRFGLAGYYPEITHSGLAGVFLADGHTIMNDEGFDYRDHDEITYGLGAAAKDVEAIVNNLILDKIKTGEDLPPWKQSWATKADIPAQNFISKKPYTGSNSVILNVILGSVMPSPYYLTGNQIKTLGGNIKKGAKSVPLVYYNFVNNLKDLSDNPGAESALLAKISGYEIKRKGKPTIRLSKANYAGKAITEKEINFLKLERNEYTSRGFLKYYRVFNVVDTEGIDYTIPDAKPKTKTEKIEIAEAIVASFKDKPKILLDKKEAKYRPSTDELFIPGIEQFDPTEEYYSTLFHELIHSTLHESRLNRSEKYKGKEKDATYAFEELIAELGASYLCGLSGIIDVTHINQASYLKGWYEKLKKLADEHTDFFLFATREAQKAVDYIIKDYVEGEKPKTDPKPKAKPQCYIDYRSKDHGFKTVREDFATHEDAVKWGKEHLDNFNLDMVQWYDDSKPEPKPKFKEGDKVTFSKHKGEVYTVGEATNIGGVFEYQIFDENTRLSFAYEKELTLYKPKTKSSSTEKEKAKVRAQALKLKLKLKLKLA